jgi:hypothetical protein
MIVRGKAAAAGFRTDNGGITLLSGCGSHLGGARSAPEGVPQHR